MADATIKELVPEENKPEESKATPKGAKKGGSVARFLAPKWLMIFLSVSIVCNGLALMKFRSAAQAASPHSSPEVSLGTFRFETLEAEQGEISGAQFELHIALLGQIDSEARRQLTKRSYRVQEDVEELLRQVHGGDFDDPVLGDLKRAIRVKINERLGMQAIAEVVITGLELSRNPRSRSDLDAAAETVPWKQPGPTVLVEE